MKKKVVSLMLCACVALAAAGCGSGKFNNPDKGEALIMATNAAFEPYEYYEGDQVVGIDVEIAQALADRLGLTLEVEDMEFDSIIPAVNSGKAHMGIAGMTITEDRLVNVDFTDPYTTSRQVIIVQDGSPITGADGLEGKTIGVQTGTTGDLFASDVKDVTMDRYSKGMDAVLALKDGKVDAVVIDSEPAKQFIAKTDGLVILEEEFAVEEYAIAVAKGNEELLDDLNKALDAIIADGTVKGIIDKYITAE
ncbi:MAG: basic amino acid ABC transporter substrate-binding protein [Lachnospiraceae bacterium]|jgi:ABC-type amino acid transport substrate-binding protein|nr:basic amino acid ABC transporter substrate-binding protein [Lachnospiraceae bacterium]